MSSTLLGALKSKTVWLNGLTAVVEAANYVTPFIPPQHHAAFAAGVAITNVALRAITTQPLSEK